MRREPRIDLERRQGVEANASRRRGATGGRGTPGARPGVERLEARAVPTGILVQGTDPGAEPLVRVFDAGTGALEFQFLAYDSGFRGGVRVAVGDVDGDGNLDIVTAPGPGMAGLVRVFSGSDGTPLGAFFGRPPSYVGGLTLAAGDVDGDGRADIVVGNDRGPGRVEVFGGVDGHLLSSFSAGTPGGRGVQVAVGDLNRDTHADIVTAPVEGRSLIRAFDGASDRLLSSYRPFAGNPRGGVSLAVGDVNGDRQLDVIVAASDPRGASVRFFTGTSGTPAGSFHEDGPQLARGVRVAAVDIGSRHAGDGVVLAPAPGSPRARSGGLGAIVLDTDAFRERLIGPQPASTAPTVAYRLPDGSGGGPVAASDSVALATPAVAASSVHDATDVPPYQRLTRYVFNPATGLPELVPVVPNDPALVGKHVIVLVHGWAPDYSYWVNAEANPPAPAQGKLLTWWNTDPSQPGYDLAANLTANAQADTTLGPAASWLLHGYTTGDIDVADIGMAQIIAARAAQTDPKTVVLAYTWLDDSGTASSTDAYLSEAKTVLNGERLADALRTALGSQSAFGGEIQLVGHSHGSKVATVAAVSLATKDAPDTFDVRQLTTLDSPEDDSTLSSDLWANNFNWYFIQDLDLNRQDPNATFVDNYISYLDEPYGNITTPTGTKLDQVVDVQLDSSPIPLIDKHTYAALWYAGSGEAARTFGASVGQEWSPLLPGNQGTQKPPATLASAYTQPWAGSSYNPAQQYVLQSTTLDSRAYFSYPLAFDTTVTAPSVTVTNPSTGADVVLTQTSGVPQPYYDGTFETSHGRLSGISFDYQFSSVSQGATLTITMDGDPVFVMDAAAVETRAGRGTITLPQSIISPGTSHTLDVILTPAAGSSGVQVAVSNLNFFYATS